MSCRDKVRVGKGHDFVKNGQNKNQKPHAQLHIIRRQSIKFQISPMKDVRVAGTRSDRWKDGQNDGQTDGQMYTHMEGVISIVPHSLRRVTIIH